MVCDPAATGDATGIARHLSKQARATVIAGDQGARRGFSGSGDGATYWRRRTFRRGENMALDRARDLVERLLDDRAKLAASEQAALERENPPAIDKAKQRDIEGGWL
jgi:hypothetical protein